MIDVYKTGNALTFQIGPHKCPVTLNEATQLRDMVTDGSYLNVISDEEGWFFGSLKIECAVAYEHPWEKRQRVILHYGKMKWHLTRSEMESIADKFEHQLNE